MEFTLVRYELENHVATITLNRPEVRNALNHDAYAQLEAAFRRAQAAPAVRCVLLTAEDPAFCSGDDVKEIMLGAERESALERLRQVRPEPTPAAVAVLECDRPVIAAVNGRRYMKEGLRRATYGDIRELGAYVGATLAVLFATEDHREGALSFVERRAPVFKGK